MKIARYKKVKQILNTYCTVFGVRKPYQLLADGTLCVAAVQNKVNLKEQLPKYLLSEVKLLTTKCALIEAERVAKKITGALIVLRQFGVHECGHRSPVSAADCFRSMIGADNSSHYAVATQDRSLQDDFRKIPGVPLLYLHAKSPTLDRLSEASLRVVRLKTENLFSVTESQGETLKRLKESSGIADEDAARPPKRRKRKGPNPLSCLPSKKKSKGSSDPSSRKPESEIKKRKRKKLPAHVKEALRRQIET